MGSHWAPAPRRHPSSRGCSLSIKLSCAFKTVAIVMVITPDSGCSLMDSREERWMGVAGVMLNGVNERLTPLNCSAD